MASENIVTVSDSTFEKEVLQAQQAVLVDFWAAWCGPCKMIAPVIDEIADEYAGKIKVAKLNVDDNPQTSAQYGVMSIPTLIIYKNGDEVERIIGFKTKKELDSILEKYA